MAVGHQGSRIDFRTRTRFPTEFVEYRRDGPGGRAACDKRRLLRGGQGLAGEAPSSNGGEFGSGQMGDGDDGAIHASARPIWHARRSVRHSIRHHSYSDEKRREKSKLSGGGYAINKTG